MGMFLLMVFVACLFNLFMLCMMFISKSSTGRGTFIFMSLLVLIEAIIIFKMLPHMNN